MLNKKFVGFSSIYYHVLCSSGRNNFIKGYIKINSISIKCTQEVTVPTVYVLITEQQSMRSQARTEQLELALPDFIAGIPHSPLSTTKNFH